MAEIISRRQVTSGTPQTADEHYSDAVRVYEMLRSGAGDETLARFLSRLGSQRRNFAYIDLEMALATARELRVVYRSGERSVSTRELLYSPGNDPFAPELIRSLYNMVWGIGWGLRFAVAFSLLATLSTILSDGEAIERLGVSLLAVIGLYFLGGITGGITLGLLRPLTRKRVGSAIVGVLVMIPMSVATGWVLFGRAAQWDAIEAVVIALMSVLYGLLGGWLYWEPRVSGPGSESAQG